MAQFEEDYALALQLQEQLNSETALTNEKIKSPSLVDPYWETTDPNPDVRALFLQFNDRFFWGRLAGIEVRWSPRMTLCAGLCCYEGRGGLCSVRLSVPLLKLRPRKDLVETLLHEMIHAYLFVTDNNKDHDGHGPEFHKHMYRINKEAGTNITVYHNFHDEVESYRQHWWRCDGPCRDRKPFYGYVKRTMNRAPSKNDTWWAEHQRTCGGTYTKIKEPEDYGKKKGKDKEQGKEMKDNKKEVKSSVKSMDIRVFGGKGVTLSGQTVAKPEHLSPKKPPSATTTSTAMKINQDKNNGTLVKEPNKMPSLPKLKLPNAKGATNIWTGKGSGKKAEPVMNKSNSNTVRQEKFTDSDFSDSDDDFMFTVSEDQTGMVTDSNKKDGVKIDGEKTSLQGNNTNDTGKHPQGGNTSDDSNDVRAMLRKVWGEKNKGTTNKKKLFKTKSIGTSSRINVKNNGITVSSKNESSSNSSAIINGKKFSPGSEVKKSITNVYGNDKKRHFIEDYEGDIPVSKRLKPDTVSETNTIGVDSGLGISASNSSGDKNHFRDAFSDLKIKSDNKISDRTESMKSGERSKLFHKIKTGESASPQKDKKVQEHQTVKSPIERLFNKITDKHKGDSNGKCNRDVIKEINVLNVNSEGALGSVEVQDISNCPVCNEGVPTASINEHLDLCLTLKVL